MILCWSLLSYAEGSALTSVFSKNGSHVPITLTARLDGAVRQQDHSDPEPASSDQREAVRLNDSAKELAAQGKYVES